MQELDVRITPYCNHYASHLPVVNSIGLVRPEKAQSIERMLIRMAQMGQIQGKVFSTIDINYPVVPHKALLCELKRMLGL